MAEFFELDLMDLLPRKLPREYEIGAPFDKGPQSNLVAGAGFEPATSGLCAQRATELLHRASIALETYSVQRSITLLTST